MGTGVDGEVFQDEADLAYEEDIIRNPYSVRCWLRYADHKRNAPIQQLNMVFERAVRELPGRYVDSVCVVVLVCSYVCTIASLQLQTLVQLPED